MEYPETEYAGFRCWKPSEANRVLDADALQVPPGVFRAVHHPVRAYRRNPLVGEREGVPQWSGGTLYSEGEFLADLLDEEVDYRLVSVIGQAGTGKSHLIRWLATRIPETPQRRVILVPRAGTNLRDLIRRILQGMEGDAFDGFRQQLASAANPLEEERGRGRLLDLIAEAIEHGEGRAEGLLRDYPEALHKYLRYALDEAPSFLRDRHFRPKWLRGGGVIARIYDSVLGAAQDVERLSGRRQFEKEDLPIDLADAPGAAPQTAKFFRHLVRNEDLQKALLLVLDRFFDDAIGGLLNIGSEDLTTLLREVRRELERRGRELVLLIEDVARLQGIDRQFLDALLERPASDEGRLCPLRAVVGCTDGYFSELPNTFRTRCSFLVDLNVAKEDARQVGDTVVAMAANYLGAARVGVESLAAWHDENPMDAPAPNRCATCDFRERCHEAFGAVEGIGLYPLGATALTQMYGRTKAEGLNPRFLLQDVLGQVLVTYADDIPSGAFPSKDLHEDFGGLSERWGAGAKRGVERADPSNASRHLALLDLWSGVAAPARMPAAVYEAFKLRPLDAALKEAETIGTEIGEETNTRSEPAAEDGVSKPEPEPTGSKEPDVPSRVLNMLRALDNWSRGQRLDQTVTNDLRKALYAALRDRIDWDAEDLVPSLLAQSTGGAFRRTSVNFEDQATSVAGTEVSVTLPLEYGPNRTDTALALQGLVLYGHHGHWGFEGGGERLIDYARLLETTAEEVVRQLRRPAGSEWDPGVAAAELLSLGARLFGEPTSSKTTPEDRLDALYSTWEAPDRAEVSTEWASLAKKFADQQETLRDLMEAYLLNGKGGGRQTKFIDTSRLAGLLARTSLIPRTELPSPLSSRLRVLQTMQDEVRERLDTALSAEQSRWVRWADGVTGWWGTDELDDVRKAVLEARDDLEARGLLRLTPTDLDTLNARSRSLRASDLMQLRSLAARIAEGRTDSDVGRSALARDVGHAVAQRSAAQRITEYGQIAQKMLADSEEVIDDQMSNVEGGASLETVFTEIEETLDALVDTLAEAPMEGDEPPESGHHLGGDHSSGSNRSAGEGTSEGSNAGSGDGAASGSVIAK